MQESPALRACVPSCGCPEKTAYSPTTSDSGGGTEVFTITARFCSTTSTYFYQGPGTYDDVEQHSGIYSLTTIQPLHAIYEKEKEAAAQQLDAGSANSCLTGVSI